MHLLAVRQSILIVTSILLTAFVVKAVLRLGTFISYISLYIYVCMPSCDYSSCFNIHRPVLLTTRLCRQDLEIEIDRFEIARDQIAEVSVAHITTAQLSGCHRELTRLTEHSITGSAT